MSRKFTKAKQDEFLEHMREGMRRGAAAAALNLERRQVLDFIAENPEYERAVLDAEGEATEHVEEALYQAAISGSVPACKLWLDLRRPKQRQQMIPSAPGEPANVGNDEPDIDAEFAELMNLTKGGDE